MSRTRTLTNFLCEYRQTDGKRIDSVNWLIWAGQQGATVSFFQSRGVGQNLLGWLSLLIPRRDWESTVSSRGTVACHGLAGDRKRELSLRTSSTLLAAEALACTVGQEASLAVGVELGRPLQTGRRPSGSAAPRRNSESCRWYTVAGLSWVLLPLRTWHHSGQPQW